VGEAAEVVGVDIHGRDPWWDSASQQKAGQARYCINGDRAGRESNAA
jgi:hypothetical protein